MARLYELKNDALRLQELLEDGTIDLETFQDTLESIEFEIEEKADNYAKLMKNIDSDINGYEEEEKRLADRRRALEGKVKSMKDNLESSMIAINKKKFKTDYFSFNIQKNPPSVNVLDIDKISKDYFKVVESVDKTAIKKALKDGEIVEGAELVQTEGLRIR